MAFIHRLPFFINRTSVMGRKNHHALIENQKAKKGKPESATKLNKVKKDKNAFKVTSQNKKVNKKAKQVQKQVQNVSYSGPTDA